MNSNIVFTDIFQVGDINRGGKKFDRVSRLNATSESADTEIILDFNSEIYPLKISDKFTMCLSLSLQEGSISVKKDSWREENLKSLADDYEYVMFGKVYKYDESVRNKSTVYISFGGLLLCISGEPLDVLSLVQRDFPLSRETRSKKRYYPRFLDFTLGDHHVFKHDRFLTTVSHEFNSKNSTLLNTSSSENIKRRSNIVFGDAGKLNQERFSSISTNSYRQYPAPPQPQQTKKSPWNNSNSLLMASAHNGIATRFDLPADNKNFNSFSTTTATSYDKPDLSSYKKDTFVKHTSSIPQGDGRKILDYSTESLASYKPHCIQRDSFSHANQLNSNKGVFGKSGQPTNFTTTQQVYGSIPTQATLQSTLQAKIRGQTSSISFGEFNEVESRSDPQKDTKTPATITQNDFKPHNSLPSSLVQYPEYKHGRYFGMKSALMTEQNSCGDTSFNEQFRYVPEPPPKPIISANELVYKSSIMKDSYKHEHETTPCTTMSSSYSHDYVTVVPKFPVLGLHVTESHFGLSDGITTRQMGSSLAKESFTHTKIPKNVRQKPTDTYKVSQDESQKISQTTTQDIYSSKPIQKTQAIVPKVAGKKLLFPVRKVEYETTFNWFHGDRDGIQNVKLPQTVFAAPQSSIVFGDLN